MPQLLQIDDDEFNVDDLDVEWDPDDEGGNYVKYEGEDPPSGTLLRGRVVKAWWLYSKNDDPQIKVVFEAEGNTGDEEEYNGCPIWETMTFIPSAGFKYQPWLAQFGLTLKAVKTSTKVEDEDDKIGAPIVSIGKWKPGGDNSWCSVLTGRRKWNDKWNTEVSRWLDYPDDAQDGPADEPDDEPAPAPRRTRAAASAPAKAPARGRRAAPAAEPDDDEPADEPKPAARGRRSPAATGPKTAGRKPGARRQTPAQSDEEVPF